MRRIRKRRRRLYLLIIVLLLSIGIGYASLNTTLSISGTTNITGNTWDVFFSNPQVLGTTTGTVVSTPTITGKTSVGFEISLGAPNQTYEYSISVTNNGSISAKIGSFTMTELTSAQQQYLEYTVKYYDGSDINVGDVLGVGVTKTFKIHIKYKNVALENMVASDDTFNLNFAINYIQNI